MSLLTLGQASTLCGKSKQAILESIRKGRISAVKDELGKWQIDPSELTRVYPVPSSSGTPQPDETEHSTNTKLLIENAALKAKLDALEELNKQIEGERDSLREQNTRITALLAAPKDDSRFDAILERLNEIEKSNQEPTPEEPTEATKKGFFGRLFG